MVDVLALLAMFIVAVVVAVASHIRAEHAEERYRESERRLGEHYAQLLSRQQEAVTKLATQVQAPDARISAALYGEYATLGQEKRHEDEEDEEWVRDPASEIPMVDDDLQGFSDLLPIESD